MSEDDWGAGFGKAVALFLNGDGIRELGPQGERISDDSFFLCFNAHSEPIRFTMPPVEYGGKWHAVIDTADPTEDDRMVSAAEEIAVESRSLLVLVRTA
jgi:glycogen operon protein